jgi:hypothetical protein
VRRRSELGRVRKTLEVLLRLADRCTGVGIERFEQAAPVLQDARKDLKTVRWQHAVAKYRDPFDRRTWQILAGWRFVLRLRRDDEEDDENHKQSHGIRSR